MQKKCIILTGMPGSGKSTIGALLSEALAMPFIDSDKIIEAIYARRLEDVTKSLSREQFLDAECQVIEAINLPGCIIATGGSVIYRKAAMEHLKRLGDIIYLTLPLAAVEERVATNPERGISFGVGQTLADLYAERIGLYKQYADLECDTGNISPGESARRIRSMLAQKKAGSLPAS